MIDSTKRNELKLRIIGDFLRFADQELDGRDPDPVDFAEGVIQEVELSLEL